MHPCCNLIPILQVTQNEVAGFWTALQMCVRVCGYVLMLNLLNRSPACGKLAHQDGRCAKHFHPMCKYVPCI